ncbi:hypothetical protein Y023_5118 [Burkholderia pseudomallei A79D]|nr:hypothetical protein Y023_5118 [Burkholderia pseudomallei A79D]KGX97301.1 hypothetical protein X997_4801 [Burkholderia pseudomallei A79C]
MRRSRFRQSAHSFRHQNSGTKKAPEGAPGPRRSRQSAVSFLRLPRRTEAVARASLRRHDDARLIRNIDGAAAQDACGNRQCDDDFLHVVSP